MGGVKDEGKSLDHLVPEKVNKVRRLLYVRPGKCMSEIDVFYVPKGEHDIRLVYNGSSCGLNDILWAPWFKLPTATTHLRSIDGHGYMGDLDCGDQFHNFQLHEEVRKYVGVNYNNIRFDMDDLGPLASLLVMNKGRDPWGALVRQEGGELLPRQCMGLRPAPLQQYCNDASGNGSGERRYKRY